jgi:addiction module HigA family antidote
MPMKNSPHPGQIIRDGCPERRGLTVTEAAGVLDVARPTLSNVLNGRAGVSPEMAIRNEKAFGSTADAWLCLQAAFDLAHAREPETYIKVTYHVKA